jgi:hypothetical protein
VPDQPHVVVTGRGVATGTPDQCRLQIALNCMAETAAEALARCADMGTLAIAAIGEVEVDQREVRTMGLSVGDFFDKVEGRVTARIGTYQLEVTIQPVDGVGGILTALASSVGDVLQVHGIELAVREPEPLRSEARRLAVQDAKTKAVELSEEAGIRLGSILALEDDAARAGNMPSPRRAMTMAAQSAASVPIEPGEVSTTSTVTLTYAIEQ